MNYCLVQPSQTDILKTLSIHILTDLFIDIVSFFRMKKIELTKINGYYIFMQCCSFVVERNVTYFIGILMSLESHQ